MPELDSLLSLVEKRKWIFFIDAGGMRSKAKAEKLLSLAEQTGCEVRLVEIDVTDTGSVTKGTQEVISDAGRLDVLINNAGIGWNAAVEDVDIEAAKLVFDLEEEAEVESV